jgi:hypothetical protein
MKSEIAPKLPFRAEDKSLTKEEMKLPDYSLG